MSWSCTRSKQAGSSLLVLLLLALIPLASQAETVTIKRNGVMLREGPGNYFGLVSVLNAGTEGEQKGEQTGWLELLVKTENGWISSNALSAPPEGSTLSGLGGAQSSGEVVPVEVLVASIKGLTAERNVNVAGGAPAIVPAVSISPAEHRRLRGSLSQPAPNPVRELPEPILAPSMLAMMPVLAAEEVGGLGGADAKATDYASMVLLAITEGLGLPQVPASAWVAKQGSGAYSYPGGTIVLGGELVAMFEDEAELAAVLAHELTHVLLRHGEKAMAGEAWRGKRASAFDRLNEETADDEENWPELASDDFFASASAKFNSLRDMARRAHSMQDETESDAMAVRMIASLGYDPAAMKDVLVKLRTKLADREPGSRISIAWVQSVDELDGRIARLDGEIARAQQTWGSNGKRFTGRFRRMIR